MHIIQCLYHLRSESFSQCQRKPLEIVVFDELIEVNTKSLEYDAHMTPEGKFVSNSHDWFRVIMVIVPKCFQNLNFNFPLFVKFIPILKDFNSN